METRPLAPYDLFWLDTHTPPGWFDVTNLRRMVEPALSVSFYESTTYLGSAGLFQLWHGVYECWLVLLVQPTDYWGFMKHVKHALMDKERIVHAHRIQSYCIAGFPEGIVLAKRMGFKHEATLEQATPDRTDLLVFAKVRR